MAVVNMFGALSLEATQAALKTAVDTLVAALRIRGNVADNDAPGIVALAVRRDSDTIGVADDGDYSMLHTDEAGRLKVATQPGSVVAATGTLTTTAAAATGLTGGAVAGAVGTIAYKVTRISNLMLHVKNTGSVSLAAGTFVWEGSLDSTNGTDGTWFGLQAVRSNANTIETSIAPATLAAGVGYAAAWELSANGLAWVRIRCTVNTTASAAATWTILPGTYATEPIPAAQVSGTQPVSGTVTANQGTLVTPTASNINSAATTNTAFIKASAGTVYNVSVYNSGASTAYVKLYNQATAPTLASAVPVIVIPVPATSTVMHNLGVVGHRFTTGIAIAITGGAGDTDTTATAAGQVKVLTSYI
jgi:hypothetical protein